jgi:peptide-methionine (S)-S-oxide reductase
MRQGNDVGTQYRSAIFYTDAEQQAVAEQATKVFGARLQDLGYGAITTEVALFGLGCFWGAEEIFWQVPGVWSTSVGYAGGTTPNPSYEEVCSGRTGHTEAVRVVYDPTKVAYADLVAAFYEVHDPTQGMRQGNDIGTQYRSAIYTYSEEQAQVAKEITERYQPELTKRGYDEITTEIKPAPTYYYAEDYHQQYLAKNPNGYRCHSTTGLDFPRAELAG